MAYGYATGAQHRVSYKSETSWATTAASGTGATGFKIARITGSSLNLKKGSIASKEIRSDRQTADFRHGIKTVQGDIAFELSYGNFDDFLSAALCSAAPTWAGNALCTWPNSGSYTVNGISMAQYIQNGTTKQSFTMERAFLDPTTSAGVAQPIYGLFTGCVINTLALSMKPGQILTGNFGFMGKVANYSTTSNIGTPNAALYNYSPYDVFSGTVMEGGIVTAGPPATIATQDSGIAASTQPILTGLDFTLSNGAQLQETLGSNMAQGVTLGQIAITGTMTGYFADLTMLNKFINESTFALSWVLAPVGGNTATSTQIWSLMNCKLGDAPLSVQNDGPISISLPFTAYADPVSGKTIQVAKTAT